MTATMIDRPTAVIQDVCAANAKQAFGHFPSGVVAVGAMLDGSPAGFAASSFTTVFLGTGPRVDLRPAQ
ncbi:flavin reductase family protein [Amycolatopsis plumensis]|uniref:flavin reductase family protein n=1 Tax=Amycolatopsis plumensis TaxID=236508 RepID=UPI0036232896